MTRRARPRPSPTLAWGVGTALATGVVALAFVPPFVDGMARAGLMHAFSFLCHQLPERSMAIGDGHAALCHRCTGILGGLALGMLVAPLAVRPFVAVIRKSLGRIHQSHRAAVALLLASAPTLVDWLLGASGLWANTPVSRVLTGSLLGLVAGLLIAHSLLSRPASVSSLSPTPA